MLLDTIPNTFRYYQGGIEKFKVIHFTCTVTSKLHIVEVIQHEDDHAYPVWRNRYNEFPDYCEPNVTYQIRLQIYGNDSCWFEFKTESGEAFKFYVDATEATYLDFPGNPYWWNTPHVIDGQKLNVVRSIKNTSALPVCIDSVVIRAGNWSCSEQFPFWLKPQEEKNIPFEFTGDGGGDRYISSGTYIFFHAQGGFADYVHTSLAVAITHAVVITSGKEKTFGRVKDGAILQMKVIVKNSGLYPFAIRKNAMQYVTTSKDSLRPGDTATCWVRWTAQFVQDSFRMEVPLFNDVSNGTSTAVIHGITNSKTRTPEKSVNPDSMIWVETEYWDLGELHRSQGQIKKSFLCKNNSPVAIVVSRVTTGDGGSMGWATRDTILSGQTFEVFFLQDLKSRVGPINRTLNVEIVFLGGSNVRVNKFIRIVGKVDMN